MPSLKELQEFFGSAVYNNQTKPLSDYIKNSGISNDDRIKIYQDNVFITLYETLMNRYPVICKLVDEEFFKFAVDEYIKQTPSASGNLDDYGQDFPQYISQMSQLKGYPYLEDVAKLEWAIHNAYFAEDAPKMEREKLSKIPQEKIGDIKFKLHPSIHLITSSYPIDKIWEISQESYKGDFNIDMNGGGSDILIARPEYKINKTVLAKDEYEFLKSIEDGLNLEQAFEQASIQSEEFDVGEAIQKFTLNGTFVEFSF